MEWTDIMLIDKPKGITSFDVIRRLRKLYTEETGEKAPKMGHAGTLDPAAQGLMIIGLSAGTKQLTDLTKLDKIYQTEIILGRSTTTGDADGEVLEEIDIQPEDVEKLTDQANYVVTTMLGLHKLPVSAYSAIKKDGVPMYKRAREAAKVGELVEDVPWRNMEVLNTHLHHTEYDEANKKFILGCFFHVVSGTYVRSLAEEVGRRIGYPASLKSLVRTKVGDFSLENAQSLPEIKKTQ